MAGTFKHFRKIRYSFVSIGIRGYGPFTARMITYKNGGLMVSYPSELRLRHLTFNLG